MDIIHLIILAIIQGLTEFLPISSSAHLILIPLVAGWDDQGLAIDVAAHLGSLSAVIIYFRKELVRILNGGFISISKQECNTTDSRLFWFLIFASLPVLLTGFIFRNEIASILRDPLIIGTASIGFGILLWFADVNGAKIRAMESVSLRDAVIIGLAQAVALIPGTSRSGITITAGLMLGLDRKSAARFSFLMAIPIILVAAAYESLKLVQMHAGIDLVNFSIVAVLSAVSAMLAIHYFLKFLEKIGLLPFVIYRVLLGIILIISFN